MSTTAPNETIEGRLRSYGSSSRILGVDLARGLAVLGMYGAHIGVVESFDWPLPATWLDLVNGRSSILFALLAGVSIAIISGRSTPFEGVELLQARVRIFTRAALIFAIGGFLQAFGTRVAVILPVYALLFVMSLPFLRWRSRSLFALAAVVAVLAPFVVASVAYPGSEGAFPAAIDLTLTGYYPAILWISFTLIGVGIGRLDLSSIRTKSWMLLAGVALMVTGYGGGAAVQLASTGRVDAASEEPVLFSLAPHSGSTFEALGSSGFAITVLALSLFVAQGGRWVLYPLIAVGSMALTAYSVQIMALAAYGDQSFEQPDNGLYLQFVLWALVLCAAWMLLLGRGPLERFLTLVSHRAAEVTRSRAPKLDPIPTSEQNGQS